MLGILQAATTAWGGYLSIKSLPAGERKNLHLSIAFGTAVIGVALVVAIGLAQKEAAKAQGKMQDDLTAARKDAGDSRDAEEFIKGQMSALRVTVGQINESGGLNKQQVMSAISEISRSVSNVERNSKPVDNSSLLNRTNQVAEEFDLALRRRYMDGTLTPNRIFDQRHSQVRDNKEETAKLQALVDKMTADSNDNLRTSLRSLGGEALYLQNEMIRRIDPRNSMDLENQKFAEYFRLCQSGGCNWNTPLNERAGPYLKALAARMPKK